MSKIYNNAGRSLIVDRVIERRRRSTPTMTSILQSISSQTQQKDLDAMKDALNGITSDGIITPAEKQGLKREWAALQVVYYSIAEQFTSNPDLADNASFILLRQSFVALQELMNRILADMDSDYTGDDVKELSDDFTKVYEQITICQTVLNQLSDFLKNYYISVSGSREVLNGVQISAGIYRNGIEQSNPEYIDGSNYTWRRVDEADSWTPRTGKSIIISTSDLPVSPCRFSVTWKDADGTTGESLSIVFEVQYGTIVEYAWSNALTAEDLLAMMPSAWSSTPAEQPAGVKYLWRRESSDNRKTYTYFRTTGEQGEQGADGAPAYSMTLSSDSYVFPASSGGTVPDTEYGIIAQMAIYAGTVREDLSGWTLSAVASDASLISCSISADGKVSVSRFDATIDSGTITVSASKGTMLLAKVLNISKAKQGADGAAGASPKYYYKYTKTDDPDAWKGGATLFTYRDYVFAVGSTLLTAGMGGWSEHVPQGTQYADDFLWTKIVYADGSYDIIPPAQKGEPAKDIRIVASAESYQLSTRGEVLVKQDFTFTLERNYVTGTASWSVYPAADNENLTAEPDASNPDVYRVSVLAGSSLPYFDVSVTCEGYEITRTLRVMGIDGGMESPIYLKVYPKDLNAAKPILYRDTMQVVDNGFEWPDKTDEGHLIEGDYVLVLTEVRESQSTTEGEIEPIPFTWVPGVGTQDEGHWELLDEDSPAYSEAMGTMLSDVVRLPDMPVTVGAYYGFFEDLSAQTAFINRLFARQIHIIGNGVIYGGDYRADGSRIPAPKEGEEDQRQFGGKGFHFSAQTGLLQATKAQLYDVDIISIDANQKTVLRTYRSEDTAAFTYDFDVTPTCFKPSSTTLPIVNGQMLRPASWETVAGFSGLVCKVKSFSLSSNYASYSPVVFYPQQDCKLGLIVNGEVYDYEDGYGEQDVTLRIYVNGTQVNQETFERGEDPEDCILLPLTDVEEGDEVTFSAGISGNDGGYWHLDFDFYVQFTSSLENAFASVSSPDLAWIASVADPDTGYRFRNLDAIRASSDGDYANIGTATVSNVDVQYASYVTGIIAGLSSNMESGKTYTATATSTLEWNGVTKNISQATRSGSTFTFIFEDGSSAIISDTHTACDLHLEVTSQPSYIDVYRLMITDPNGSIGTTNERVPAVYADYLYGRLPLSNFAGFDQNASTTKPAVIIAVSRGSLSSSYYRITNETGTLLVISMYMSVRSDGYAEVMINVTVTDDTYAFLDIPLPFNTQINFVQASGFRTDMKQTGDTPPGLSGTGKDAQFNSYHYGLTATGSSHYWTRLVVMNDYGAAEGWITVTGQITEDVYDDIVAHNGSLDFLFDI